MSTPANIAATVAELKAANTLSSARFRWLRAAEMSAVSFCGAVLLSLQTGCSTFVHRLDGEYPTRVGVARSACEASQWLVAAPTRTEIVQEDQKKPTIRDDGIAYYPVGSSSPISVFELESQVGHRSAMFDEHGAIVRSYDQRRIMAAGLGTAGILALSIGTVLFIGAFDTDRDDGMTASSSDVDSARLLAAGLVAAGGLGLGIAGIALAPSLAERSRAQTYRYVFLPPEDPRDEVLEIAAQHNERVRERCSELEASP